MSVNVDFPAVSDISQPLDSLKVTAPIMHRVYFEVSSVDTWYAIMREARQLFGTNWRAQPRVKRRLEKRQWYSERLHPPGEVIWFEVPDLQFGTWIALKHAVTQVDPKNK